MRNLKRRALALAVALGASGAAQIARGEPTAQPTIGLSLDGAFDSNVYNGRGPDYVTRITPRLALKVEDERTQLKLSYDLGLWMYAEGKAENSINHQGDVVLESRLTRRLTLRLADEIIYARDPGFLARAGVVAPQTSIFDNTAEGALGYRLTRLFDGGLSYSYRHTTFGAPPAGAAPLYDGDEHDGAASLTFRASRSDDLRVSDRLSYYTANGAGLALMDSPALGWRHQFVPWLESRIEGGPAFYHALEGGQQLLMQMPLLPGQLSPVTASGTTWRAAAVLRFATPHWRAALTGMRDLVGGTGAGAVLWADYLTASASYKVQQRIELRGAVGVFANGFAPSEPRIYDGVTTDAAVDVTLVRGLHLAGYYSFRWQEAPMHDPNAPLPEVMRHVVGLRFMALYGDEAMPPRHPIHE